jgi:hypothetical protein
VTPIENGPYAGPGWPEIAQWFDEAIATIGEDTYFSVPPVPNVMFNPEAEPKHPADMNLAGSSWTVAPDQIAFSPGAAGQYSVARFTAPERGSYSIASAFKGLCGDNGAPMTTADVHVQHNGTDLATGSIDPSASNAFAFSDRIELEAGDTVDFAIGAAGGLFICPDVVALRASVCADSN